MAQPVEAENPVHSKKTAFLFGLLMAVAVFAAYYPALHGKFLWDDNAWTTDILKLHRDISGLGLIWDKPTALQQYYPLTGTSFWLDYYFWKLWTFPYHVENVLLHLIAVFLFWKLLQKLEVPGAWLAAGIFALHPVMVESVAWVTERKNVLSMVFFLGALLAYGKFNSFWKDEKDSPRKWGAYILAFFLFALALLAKTATFSLPAVILLICWWKRGHISWKREILPALPFFTIAIGFSAMTAWLEKNHVGAEGWEWNLSFGQRSLIAGRVFWFYIGKFLWPENLCFIYPRWKPDATLWWQWIFPVAALVALASPWLARKKIGRGPATAGFYYVGTLFPVLGFLNVYGARYSFVWDHWVYLSSLGIIALAAALIANLAKGFHRGALFGFAMVLLAVLTLLSWKQSRMYQDNETLWRATIAKDADAFLAYNNLGYILLERNQLSDAILLFEKALKINPNFSEPHNNLGDALIRAGRTNEGMAHFKKALELIQSDATTAAASYYNYGDAWLETGHPEEAVVQFKKALQIYPTFARAQNNLGSAFLQLGDTNAAFDCFQKAIEDDPELPEAHNNLGNMLIMRGQTSDATEQFQKAFELRPDFQEALNNLVGLLLLQKKPDEAIKCYEQALRYKETGAIHNDLGNLLVRQNRRNEAIQHYERAIKLKPEIGEFHYNLAVVLALQNRLDEAVAEFGKTLRLTPNSAQAHYRLALTLQAQKKFAPAMEHFQKALEIDPKHGLAANNLAWLLATCPDAALRNGKKAIMLAKQAERISGSGHPEILDTLAAAYAEAGQFANAVETAKQALTMAVSQNNARLADAIRNRLKLYQAGSPFHES